MSNLIAIGAAVIMTLLLAAIFGPAWVLTPAVVAIVPLVVGVVGIVVAVIAEALQSY